MLEIWENQGGGGGCAGTINTVRTADRTAAVAAAAAIPADAVAAVAAANAADAAANVAAALTKCVRVVRVDGTVTTTALRVCCVFRVRTRSTSQFRNPCSPSQREAEPDRQPRPTTLRRILSCVC